MLITILLTGNWVSKEYITVYFGIAALRATSHLSVCVTPYWFANRHWSK